MSLIKNASPQIILLGADDKSTSQVTPSLDPIPQHCPLFYIFAKKGPTNRLILSPSKLTTVYGSETFDINDKYFNHQTRYLQQMGTYGNTCMVQRLVPNDAGVRSNLAIYADVLEADVPNYKRNSDGSYVIDPDTGKNIIDDVNPTIPGYKIKFIKEYSNGKAIDPDTQTEIDVPEEDLGLLKRKTGTMFEYLETTNNERYSNIVVRNFPAQLKVNGTAVLDIGQVNEQQYKVTFTNEGVATYDNVTKTITAGGAPGVTDAIFTTTIDGEIARSVSFKLEVIATDPATSATLTVSNNTLLFDNTTRSSILNLNTNAADYEIVSSDTNVVSVDKVTKSIRAVKDGIAVITVSTKDTAKNNLSMAYAVIVRGFIPTKTVTLGVGQSKFVKLSSYDKIVGNKINPTGFFGVDTQTGALVGVKVGSAIISYVDRKGNTVENITVTVQQTAAPMGTDEQDTPFEYPPVVPDENSIRRSIMYPLFERRAKYQGEAYNNNGFAIGSLFGDEVDSKIVSELKSLPYSLALYTRDSKLASPVVLRSVYSEPSINFVFKEKAINPYTEARMDFEPIYKNNWFNETDELKPLRHWEDEGFVFYRDNFNEITNLFLEKEKEYISEEPKEWADGALSASISWFDFTTSDAEEIKQENQLLNPFIAKSSKDVNYFTLVLADNVSTLGDKQSIVSIASDSPIFLDGGSDGSLTNESFEEKVVEKMQDYIDPNSDVIDLATNVESIFYDTGFTLDTKKQLVNFITLRKDTALILSTHDDSKGEKYDTLSDTRAIAVALNNRLKLAPESEYYGTGVCRGLIAGGTGVLRDGTTNNRIPTHYEIANKAADMMGSGDGRFNNTKLFDNYPGNTVDQLIDIQPAFIPAGIKPTLWNEGLVWAQPFDRATFYFPALQTVYDNDTSVLNNFFVMMVLCNLNKVAYRVWSEFTGTSGLTDGEFIDAVTARANELLKDKYGSIVTVIPFITLTDEDKQRGYSWTMTFKLYGSNMRTVAVYTTEVYRSSDLENQ